MFDLISRQAACPSQKILAKASRPKRLLHFLSHFRCCLDLPIRWFWRQFFHLNDNPHAFPRLQSPLHKENSLPLSSLTNLSTHLPLLLPYPLLHPRPQQLRKFLYIRMINRILHAMHKLTVPIYTFISPYTQHQKSWPQDQSLTSTHHHLPPIQALRPHRINLPHAPQRIPQPAPDARHRPARIAHVVLGRRAGRLLRERPFEAEQRVQARARVGVDGVF